MLIVPQPLIALYCNGQMVIRGAKRGKVSVRRSGALDSPLAEKIEI